LTPQLYTSLYAPFYRRFDHAVLESCLEEFEVKQAVRLSELSFGQKKKFLIAFGLATGSRLLLLDEPTNGLDIPSKSQFRRLMARAGAEGRVILISTHQVRDMEHLIDPIIILDEGQIIFQQSLADAGRRLAVTLAAEAPAPGSVLYAEKTLGGYVTVRENRSGEDSRVDIEVLFNTVIGNREKVRELFAGQPSAVAREV
jgi:ABC-2 type transport system ATP-binding protein